LADSGVVFVFGANTWWRANSDLFPRKKGVIYAADTFRKNKECFSYTNITRAFDLYENEFCVFPCDPV